MDRNRAMLALQARAVDIDDLGVLQEILLLKGRSERAGRPGRGFCDGVGHLVKDARKGQRRTEHTEGAGCSLKKTAPTRRTQRWSRYGTVIIVGHQTCPFVPRSFDPSPAMCSNATQKLGIPNLGCQVRVPGYVSWRFACGQRCRLVARIGPRWRWKRMPSGMGMARDARVAVNVVDPDSGVATSSLVSETPALALTIVDNGSYPH